MEEDNIFQTEEIEKRCKGGMVIFIGKLAREIKSFKITNCLYKTN